MTQLTEILRWLILILASVSAAYWAVVLVRVIRAMLAAPSVRVGLETPQPPGGWPKVSIIVPAHNEQQVIEDCARRLTAQDYPNLEIIYVLDRCTDDTLKRLRPFAERDGRITIVENDSCPPDWAGKCNAARLGAERAAGGWLLFTDADTQFHPSLVRASVGMALGRGLDFLSLLSTLTSHEPFERLVQPVASMTLLRMYPLDRVNRAETKRRFANGQFMLFSRDIYQRIGGHVTVKDDLLEDMSFARYVRRRGGTSGVFLDGGMLVCAMYDSFPAFREGWKRIFIEACKRKPDRLRRVGGRLMVNAVCDPVLRLAAAGMAIHALAIGAVGWALALGIASGLGWLLKTGALSIVYRLGRSPGWAVLAQPWGAWHVARIMFEGARDLKARRPVRWGGREYVLEPRAPDDDNDVIHHLQGSSHGSKQAPEMHEPIPGR
ncbi:MAG: glycosyltransferase [Phycisphaeraceae bacterium]|nr:glycosyltransferase [Phycisphaerales bacterium]QOJ18854.1 MAG: glycosyltransferase [Phycisphaeraceae bacterium]